MSGMSAPSPMQPVPPPSKKQRASHDIASTDSLSNATGDAIARRRAELRRLQQLRSKNAGRPSSTFGSTEGLLAKAKTQLNASNPPPTRQASNATLQPPPQQRGVLKPSTVVPPPAHIARRLDPTFAAGRTKSAPARRPPPPPGPPQLVAEAPPRVERGATPRGQAAPQRPSPITPNLGPPKTPTEEGSARRNLLDNLRDMAESPGRTAPGSNDLRLMKALKKAKQEKEDAYRKVARLQEKMQQLQKQDRKSQEIEALVQVADRDGDRAAVKWARQQVTGSPGYSQVRTTE